MDIYLLCKYTNLKDTAGQSANYKDNQDDLVSEYVGLDSTFDDLEFHKICIIWLKWLAHLLHVL